jgi:hypothetical protein
VEFEIKYLGVTPPEGGVGGYNMILPTGWRFVETQISNSNFYGPNYEFGRDDGTDREAIALYFEGRNISFSLTVQAVQGPYADRKALGPDFHLWPRDIVEPVFHRTGLGDATHG